MIKLTSYEGFEDTGKRSHSTVYLHEDQIKEFHPEQELRGALGVAFAYSRMLPRVRANRGSPSNAVWSWNHTIHFPYVFFGGPEVFPQLPTGVR